MKTKHQHTSNLHSVSVHEDWQAVILAALIILLATIGLLGPAGIAVTF